MLRFVKLCVIVAVLLSSMVGVSAFAESVVQLGEIKKSKSVQVIGVAPEKKNIVLNLGTLRSGEADLPGRLLTRQERTKLRSERAIQRQQEVTTARRERRTSSRTAQHRSPDSNTVTTNDDDHEVAINDEGNAIME